MARRPTNPMKPERPEHTVEEKRQDILRLQRRIDELEAFDPSSTSKRFSEPAVTRLETAIASTLAAVFGHGTPEYNRYSSATRLDNGPITMATPFTASVRNEAAEARQYYGEGKADALALLHEARRSIEEEIEFAAPAPVAGSSGTSAGGAGQRTRKVFIVTSMFRGRRAPTAPPPRRRSWPIYRRISRRSSTPLRLRHSNIAQL